MLVITSCSFPTTELSGDTNILPSRLWFEVKITDIEGDYELKARDGSDGSKIIEGVDYIRLPLILTRFA